MGLAGDQCDGLNVALNEATWLAIDVDTDTNRVAVLLDSLSLPTEGQAHEDSAVALILEGVTRVAASLRHGRWNDAAAAVDTLAPADLDAAVRGFGGCPIYGWEFIDPPEESWEHWRDRLSLDVSLADDPAPHVLDLFQEGGSGNPRHLDLRIWFHDLRVRRSNGGELPVQAFIDGGVRWWDGLYSGDPRTSGKGIMPTA